MNKGTVQDGGVNVSFGLEPAERLCEGDAVVVERGPAPKLARVIAKRTGFSEGFVQLLLDDEVLLKVPGRQMFTSDSGMIGADSVRPGMALRCLDGASRKVVGAVYRPYLLFVVDLDTDKGVYGVEGVEFVRAD